MGQKSTIEWTDSSWTPIRARVKADAAEVASVKGYTSLIQLAEKMAGHIGPHCEHESPGCENCYSETNNSRCLPANGTGLPFDRRSRDLIDLFIDEHIFSQPLHWKRARKIFVCSQTDLFGKWVPDVFIGRVFGLMAEAHWHTFQVLTKHAERLYEWSRSVMYYPCGDRSQKPISGWPPNVWIGVSVEDQLRANERIPLLLKTPAVVRFVSAEPLLGPLDIRRYLQPYWNSVTGVFPEHQWLSWVIIGAESGAEARPFDLKWARNVVQQCHEAEVPCFVKQLGHRPFDTDFSGALRRDSSVCIAAKTAPWTQGFTVVYTCEGSYKIRYIKLKDRAGGDAAEWPEDLRVRQFPA